MTERQPLPGWADGNHGWQVLGRLCATGGQWYIHLGDPEDEDYEWSGWVPSLAAAQLAAEDAARALLAELAEALGVELRAGPCRWTLCQEGPDWWYWRSACAVEDGGYYVTSSRSPHDNFCQCCGGRVEVEP